MPDYKKMYLTLFRAIEQAINTLIEAQRECEEMYISEQETELKVISMTDHADEKKERTLTVHNDGCEINAHD